MGSVFKKAVTRPLPLGAEFITRQGVRLARWRDAHKKIRTAPVTTGRDGSERIRDESRTYFARHRDGSGVVVETPTGCRDESAARQVLAELERRAERVRSGLPSDVGRRPHRRSRTQELLVDLAEKYDLKVDQVKRITSELSRRE